MTNLAKQVHIFSAKRILLAFAGVFLLSGFAQAAQITLAWSKVGDSAVTGYKLYYGTQSAKYTNTVDAGNSLQRTITGLAYDKTYYFAAKSYDNSGNISGFSNEVSHNVPAPNAAPQTPVLHLGSSGVSAGSAFSCAATATDSNGDALQYRFDWGDGMVTTWGGGSQSHVWAAPGTYCIKGQAKDGDGAVSGWSACYNVTVTSADSPYEPPAGGSTGGVTPGGNSGEGGIVKLWFEAEDGDIAAPMEIADAGDASAEGYVWTPNGTGNQFSAKATSGSVQYYINVPAAGDYLIWGRVLSPTYGDDSFFVSVDGGAYIRWNTPVDQGWVWDAVASATGDDPMVYHLTQGAHLITILQREDGTQIDRLLVTNDLGYIPEGQGEIVEPGQSDIWIECENGTVASPMQIQSDSAAAGGGFIGVSNNGQIHATPDLAAGFADYVFQVPRAGDYLIWGRVLAPSYADDSFFVSIDDAPFLRWNPSVGNAWHWEPVIPDPGGGMLVSHLEAGWHTLTLLCREDGTNIDKILITSDAAYAPEGAGGEPTISMPYGKTIAIEAEKGVVNGSMITATGTDASAGQYVWAPEGSGNTFTPDAQSGAVAYTFAVPESGDYIVWGRTFSPSFSSDSFFAAMDGGTPFRWNTQVAESWTWNAATPSDSTDPMVWHLSAGTHTLVLMLREDGTMLDKITITSDLAAIPE